jgi:hypothetical protein
MFYGNGDSVLTDCNFLNCKESDGPSEGGIYADISTNVSPRPTRLNFSLTRLNFSDCGSSSSSSGVVFSSDKHFWNFSECTVVGCSGFSGLKDTSSEARRVELSSFYNNSFDPDAYSGLLYAGMWGFVVDRCIFSGNAQEFYKASSNTGFTVTNCVFSGSLPSGNFYSSTGNNNITTTTASFSFAYFGTKYCPNGLPERTPAQSPQETPSVTVTESVAATVSPEATRSDSPQETPSPTATGSIAATLTPTPKGSPERTRSESPHETPDATRNLPIVL